VCQLLACERELPTRSEAGDLHARKGRCDPSVARRPGCRTRRIA
jgi:hypothetical protein